MPAKSRVRRIHSTFRQFGPISDALSYVDLTTHWIGSLTDTRDASYPISDWKKRIREHVSATSPLSGERFKFSGQTTSGSVNQMLKAGGVGAYIPSTITYHGHTLATRISQLPSSAVISDGVAEKEATKKYFKKVAAAKKSLDGLVFLGELRETLRMLRRPAESLFKAAQTDYLQALGKRKRRDPKNWARGLSGAWLEFAFGVKPLVSDINGALQALERFNEPVALKVITAVGKQTQSIAPSSMHIWNTPGGSLVFTGTTEAFLKQKVKYRACYMRESSTIRNLTRANKLAEAFGISYSEFVPTIWELMPWSFLIDYFSNVGDILEQQFTSLENIRWNIKTVVNESVIRANSNLDIELTKARIFFANRSYYVSSNRGVGASSEISRIAFTRAAAGPAVSSLEFSIPGSYQKWLNIAALGAQANAVYPQRWSTWHRGRAPRIYRG